MQNYNRLTIDLSSVQANLEAIKAHFPEGTRLMPMVKASAYGTNENILSDFYHSVCGIDIVGVSHVFEGVSLRDKGYTSSIFVIGASAFDAPVIVQHDLEIAVDHEEVCQALNNEAIKHNKTLKVHLHLDTGMQRFGCSFEEALSLAEHIRKCPALKLEGIMTHFVAAESAEFDSFSLKQSQQLETLFIHLLQKGTPPRWVHVANSAGSVRFQLPFCNMVRVGLAALGLYSSDAERDTISLQPALTLETCILGINHCRKGDTVGYCQEYRVGKEKERIAILPLGYHDGLHLRYGGKGYVLIHGKPAPLVGRICMDFMMVNVTDIPEARIGDRV